MKLLIFIIALGFYSCSNMDHEIERESNSVVRVESRERMIDHMRDVIDENDKLSQEQKDQFFDLHIKVMDQVNDINHSIRKLKVVLFNELSQDKPSDRKMERIISKIKKLHSEKLKLMVKAFHKAKDILGIQFKEIDYQRFHNPYSLRASLDHEKR